MGGERGEGAVRAPRWVLAATEHYFLLFYAVSMEACGWGRWVYLGRCGQVAGRERWVKGVGGR